MSESAKRRVGGQRSRRESDSFAFSATYVHLPPLSSLWGQSKETDGQCVHLILLPPPPSLKESAHHVTISALCRPGSKIASIVEEPWKLFPDAVARSAKTTVIANKMPSIAWNAPNGISRIPLPLSSVLTMAFI